MKKVISISLAIIMVLLAFAGCSKGVKALTKEELLAQATEVNLDDMNSDMKNNAVAAKEKYLNKALKIEGSVAEIKDDRIVLIGEDVTNTFVDVYLPTEELVKLENSEKVLVVGETNDELAEEEQQVEGTKWTQYHFQMTNAYIVQDKFEVQVKVTTIKDIDKRQFYIDVPNYSLARIIQFAEDVDVNTIPQYKTITVSAKVVGLNYYDAEIIE